MSTMTDEALAGLRLLVCMARADGVLKPDERYAIEDALAGAQLPQGLTVDSLLFEEHDPAELAKAIQSKDVREYTYASVFSVAYCDRELAEPEKKLLELLRNAWSIDAADDGALKKALDIGANPHNPDEALPLTQRGIEARKKEFESLLGRTSILAGLTGAIPMPLVPDLMVVPLQVKLVYDIAALFGKRTNKEAIQLMFETLGVGVGARIGISALCKLVPGFGSLVGAASSFASTYALGKVAFVYFEKEQTVSFEQLKDLYREEQAHGKAEFQKKKGAIDEASRTHTQRLKALACDLQQGKITQKDYERKIDELK